MNIDLDFGVHTYRDLLKKAVGATKNRGVEARQVEHRPWVHVTDLEGNVASVDDYYRIVEAGEWGRGGTHCTLLSGSCSL